MTGRWPANVILSPGMAGVLDGQTAHLHAAGNGPESLRRVNENPNRSADATDFRRGNLANYGDSGGASRFFLTAGYEPWELDWIYANGLRPCWMEET